MSTHSQPTSGIGFRKEKHLSICADASRFSVEGGSNGFESVHFIHDALPELTAETIDLRTEFLDHTVAAPIFISCMTGGSDRGFFANRELAEAARAKRYAVGMGSIRILFDHPELFEHFHLKALAPEVPVLANIGGVQVRDEEHGRLFELVKRLASEFQTRIEMRQIGVRDEAKLLADYGDCGKAVCCNTHLAEMPPVSMKMAKLQKATLDPTKISGRCGRHFRRCRVVHDAGWKFQALPAGSYRTQGHLAGHDRRTDFRRFIFDAENQVCSFFHLCRSEIRAGLFGVVRTIFHFCRGISCRYKGFLQRRSIALA